NFSVEHPGNLPGGRRNRVEVSVADLRTLRDPVHKVNAQLWARGVGHSEIQWDAHSSAKRKGSQLSFKFLLQFANKQGVVFGVRWAVPLREVIPVSRRIAVEVVFEVEFVNALATFGDETRSRNLKDIARHRIQGLDRRQARLSG